MSQTKQKSTEKKGQTIDGIVTSDKMEKTVVVTIHTYKKHPKYFKKYRTSKKFFAHDPENQCKAGDKVRIMEVRPYSKQKRWIVTDILDKKSS